MESICKDCEHFEQISLSTDRYGFGDCMDPKTCLVDANGKEKGVFKWADGTCDNFKPKQNLQ